MSNFGNVVKASPKVFISYSHDSDAHEARVLALCEGLRARGISAWLDLYEPNPEEGWPLWMERQIEQAEFVLMICTETYLRRVKREERPGAGKGVTWEANLINNLLYIQKVENKKFLPVLMPGGRDEHIPLPLIGHAYFRVDEKGWSEDLYRVLTEQKAVVPGTIGELEVLPPLDSISEPSRTTQSNKGTGKNPFRKYGRITEPELFFGRENFLRELFERLEQGANCSLVGESQVGKSSVLSMICKRGQSMLGLPEDAFIYVDMQMIFNEDEFFEELCYQLKLGETLRGRLLNRRLQGKRYVVCIDEIEKMTRRENFSGDERVEMRGLAGSGDAPLTLAIASRSTLEELFEDRPGMTSPLAGICSKLDVGGFSLSECREFLEVRLQGTGVAFSNRQVDELIQESGGHPGRLQRAAEALFDSLTR